MKIKDKLNLDYDGLVKYGPVNIVAFGDSVTHGALNGEIDYETVYWNLLKKKLNQFRSYIPVNVINAGIGGITASASIERIERDVISHHPDIIIVCFGLNDINSSLETYLQSLEIIFTHCTVACDNVIFMTPNMLNTYIADDTAVEHLEYAAITAEYQNSGRMDEFMDAACALAARCRVTVCDAYAQWKKLAERGEDTTMLLCNRINHPTRKMHQLFADMLYNLIISDEFTAENNSDTMFNVHNA